MNYDKYGQAYTTESELCDMLYLNPELDLKLFQVVDSATYNNSVTATYAELPTIKPYVPIDYKEEVPVELFDHYQQQAWHLPDEYRQLDIAEYILGLCTTQPELQRVGEELLLFQERDLFDLLRYLKYLVDVMRENKIIWGVGRGSSVASFILYKLGVHRINSITYKLNINEFLR